MLYTDEATTVELIIGGGTLISLLLGTAAAATADMIYYCDWDEE